MNKNRKIKFIILGAGIGGLAAGAALKERGIEDFVIIERSPSLPLNLGNGVHLLHSNEIGQPFDFELKEIAVTLEVWDPRTDVFKQRANIP